MRRWALQLGSPPRISHREGLRPTATILVVDDEEIVTELLRMILQRSGYTVLTASSGEAALALCQSHQSPVNLALVDVILPGMNGPELRVRLRDVIPDLPVLYMSAYPDGELLRLGVDGTGRDFLRKPFNHLVLLERICDALPGTTERPGPSG